MPTAAEIVEELARLRESSELKLRPMVKKARLSREKLRKIAARTREPKISEVFAWIEACGEDPLLWLAQFLGPEDKKVLDRDRALIVAFRRYLRVKGKRQILENIIGSWEDDAERFRKSRKSEE